MMLVSIERIIFRNQENGYTVALVDDIEKKCTVIIAGTFTKIEKGDLIRIKGEWVMHPSYGRQFKVEQYHYETPNREKDIIRFLSSGFIPGIGVKLASIIVNHLGTETLQKIDHDPEILFHVPGIGKKRAKLITDSLLEKKALKELTLFFAQYEIPISLASKIFKYYGSNSIEIIRGNPYRLAEEIWGIGFATADKIALQIGFQKDHPERIKAAITYELLNSANDGHVFLPESILVKRACNLLDITEELCRQCLNALCDERKLIRERFQTDSIENDTLIYLPYLWMAEFEVAELINSRRGDFLKMPVSVDQMITNFQKTNDIMLDHEQLTAIKNSLINRMFIITGGPGTGKTTILKCLTSIYNDLKIKYALAAPTGRAARRLQELTDVHSQTIHKLLEYDPVANKFTRERNNILKVHSVIIDETSMLDLQLLHALLKAMHQKAQLIMIGDKDQLPSVGPGNVLNDLIRSDKIPCIVLKEIYRQAKNSLIIRGAYNINNGEFPYMVTKKNESGDFYFIPEKITQRAINILIKIITEKFTVPDNRRVLEKVQVIAPMYKGIAGIDNLNVVLQNTLNPLAQGKKLLGEYRLGDKVMQIKNNYEKNVFNGDIGFIVNIDENLKTLMINFQGNLVPYTIDAFDEITLAYAITAHKAEGSEFDVVIIMLFKEHFIMLKRNWLYTAVTRARSRLIIIGEEEALRIAVNNESVSRRYTLLRERLT